jgi:hypothetical protein
MLGAMARSLATGERVFVERDDRPNRCGNDFRQFALLVTRSARRQGSRQPIRHTSDSRQYSIQDGSKAGNFKADN